MTRQCSFVNTLLHRPFDSNIRTDLYFEQEVFQSIEMELQNLVERVLGAFSLMDHFETESKDLKLVQACMQLMTALVAKMLMQEEEVLVVLQLQFQLAEEVVVELQQSYQLEVAEAVEHQ